MSNYKYKNISLNTILQSNDKNTNSQYGYKGLPNLNPSNYANYNYMRPLFFGYSDNSGGLENRSVATYRQYNSSTNGISIPSGCNQLNIITVGGGGGGAGNSGTSQVKYPNSYVTANGADGGNGGVGTYEYGTVNVSNENSFNVTVGNGGGGGYSSNNYYYGGQSNWNTYNWNAIISFCQKRR